MNTQIITTPSGERMIVLPEGEFHSLLQAAENAEDAAAVKEFEKRAKEFEKQVFILFDNHVMLQVEVKPHNFVYQYRRK